MWLSVSRVTGLHPDDEERGGNRTCSTGARGATPRPRVRRGVSNVVSTASLFMAACSLCLRTRVPHAVLGGGKRRWNDRYLSRVPKLCSGDTGRSKLLIKQTRIRSLPDKLTNFKGL